LGGGGGKRNSTTRGSCLWNVVEENEALGGFLMRSIEENEKEMIEV
jgi:hypothetical protein